MKISPPLSVLTLIGVSLLALSVNRYCTLKQRVEIRRLQCDVTLTHLTDLKAELNKLDGKPLLLLEAPEKVNSMEQINLAIDQNPHFKNHPDVKIEIQKSKTAELSPVKLCQNVRKWAIENRVRTEAGAPQHKDSSTPDWLFADKNDEFGWKIIRVSMPVISANGKSAYLNESVYFGPMAGGGVAVVYKKSSDGTWKLSDRIGLYVS